MKKVFIPRNTNYFPWYSNVNDANINGIQDILMTFRSGVLTVIRNTGKTKEPKSAVENEK